MSDQVKNIPYVKAYDANGDLINPILFKYRNDKPNRKARRLANGTTSTRPFGNSKGIILKVVDLGRAGFIKFHGRLIDQGAGKGTRLQYLSK
tara:strand:+ start:8205 stop:8480 length:276 start_codon:yes stop_codon:yes gene_type:complete